MSKIACQNCGAPGMAGSVCEFCDSTIVRTATAVASGKKPRKRAPRKETQYSSWPYAYFWNRLTCDPYVPDDVFDTLTITAVYEFWIPAFIWRESLTCKDRRTHLEIIRQWAVDRSFEDDIPDNYPKSERIEVCIIDFEYKDGKFWYIYFESEEPMYPGQLRYNRSMSKGNNMMFFNLDDKIALSDELSDFPPGWDAMMQEAMDVVDSYRSNIINTPYKPETSYSTIYILIVIGIVMCRLYNITYFFPLVGVILCIAGLLAGYSDFEGYKNYLRKRKEAEQTYNSRIKIIKTGEYRNFTLEFCSSTKYSKEKRERGYWAYRKANPTPFSSCQNYYKL